MKQDEGGRRVDLREDPLQRAALPVARTLREGDLIS
jgi:hypothetical protein